MQRLHCISRQVPIKSLGGQKLLLQVTSCHLTLPPMGHYTPSVLLPQEALVMVANKMEQVCATANMQICRVVYVSCVTESNTVCLRVPRQDRPCLCFCVGLAALASSAQAQPCYMWLAGAFEGGSSQGLSLNAFLQWSNQLPALLTSLKSLLAAGSVETDTTATHHVIARHSCILLLLRIHALCCLSYLPVFCCPRICSSCACSCLLLLIRLLQ